MKHHEKHGEKKKRKEGIDDTKYKGGTDVFHLLRQLVARSSPLFFPTRFPSNNLPTMRGRIFLNEREQITKKKKRAYTQYR